MLTAFVLYIIFILITKCNINIFFIIILLLGTTYIINIIKEDEIESSKKELDENNIYDKITFILYILIIVFIILGVLLYIGEKKIEYKKDFNYITFFVGKSVCKGESPGRNMLEAIKHIFK